MTQIEEEIAHSSLLLFALDFVDVDIFRKHLPLGARLHGVSLMLSGFKSVISVYTRKRRDSMIEIVLPIGK